MTRSRQSSISGLYAVTPDTQDTGKLYAMVEASLQGGVRLVQYRNKAADQYLCASQAAALLKLCRRYHAKMLINDHVDICINLDADGVHLGGTDGDIAATRSKLGPNKIIGASCYNQLELAKSAQAAGASYVAFGACFSSDTKPNAVKADLGLFAADLNIPKVAIGGITLENAPQVIQAGADAIAVINALYAAEDVKSQTEKFAQLFINHDFA